jgi:hypothetical protein
MKTQLLLKVVLVLPLVLFVDWVLMILLGCASRLFGTGDTFYCGSYCLLGKGILFLSALFFLCLLYPDFKKIRKHHRHA